VRIVIHAGNTTAQLDVLAASICEWAQEMLDIEEGRTVGVKLPSVMRQMYGLMAASEVMHQNPSAQAGNPFLE
jgi:8-amino-7-oxononanoate synthase